MRDSVVAFESMHPAATESGGWWRSPGQVTWQKSKIFGTTTQTDNNPNRQQRAPLAQMDFQGFPFDKGSSFQLLNRISSKKRSRLHKHGHPNLPRTMLRQPYLSTAGTSRLRILDRGAFWYVNSSPCFLAKSIQPLAVGYAVGQKSNQNRLQRKSFKRKSSLVPATSRKAEPFLALCLTQQYWSGNHNPAFTS